jgi:signal transduction histidine kinase
MKSILKFSVAAGIALALSASAGFAADGHATKDEAVAMAKKAVALVKAEGAAKAYEEFNKGATFHDRDLYVIVYDSTGTCLAHGSTPKKIGKNLVDDQDADGVFYIKKRVDLMKTNATFWQDYKFTDPVTKKIAPKSTYCEKLNDTAVCVGVYK